MNKSTLSVVQDLKNADQDFSWYPTKASQIAVIVKDIKEMKQHFEFSSRYNETVKFLDIGAGDARVILDVQKAFSDSENFHIDGYAIEKATVHTDTYRTKNITLIGTEFDQINFISKQAEICFTNPPYERFNSWMQTLINHLQFGILYAILPERWIDDQGIKEAMKFRGIEYAEVLDEDDFLDGDRAARAKVHLIRFSFEDLNPENLEPRTRRYKPTIGRDSSDPFQLFLENELGLKKTYSDTTEKFNEYTQRERIKKEMATEGTQSFELVESRGILWALLDNYEVDLARTLDQYKLISQISPQLLQELGVNYDNLRNGAKEKLLGYRNVYWGLLFEKLEAISSRLTSKHQKALLTKLSSNALDFTYTNSIYIINYAVETGNELIEESLLDVYQGLTSPDSISKYYKSNQHIYKDDWRYNQDENQKAKYLLDYRFIHSSYSNFSSHSWEKGLCENARGFTNDLLVSFKLLGYANLYLTSSYDSILAGEKVSIMGTDPEGEVIELLQIKFFGNGNKHLKYDKKAMLRLNVTCSRLLGWVRTKEDFTNESDTKKPVDENIWDISNKMKVSANNILMLTNQAA
jgi:hypothetical protein